MRKAKFRRQLTSPAHLLPLETLVSGLFEQAAENNLREFFRLMYDEGLPATLPRNDVIKALSISLFEQRIQLEGELSLGAGLVITAAVGRVHIRT